LISVDRLKVAAALVMTAPFIPMLFQGEEWGASSPFLYFTDHEDPELGRAVTEGRRREFASFREHGEQVPDPQALGTFKRSKLIWAERQQQPHATLLDWHRRLIRLRRETPSLSDGRFERLTVDFDEQSAWLVVKRGPIAVVCNLAESAVRIPIGTATVARVLLASHGNISIIGDTVELPSDSVAVLRLESGKGDLGDN
jgi:maltooligosyltrehalose trehalohydrolase